MYNSTISTLKKRLETLIDSYCEIVEQNNKYEKGYGLITDIITPYLSDFTGINDAGQFDLVLAIDELMQELKAYRKDSIKLEIDYD